MIKVDSDGKKIVLIWDFRVSDNLQPINLVKAILDHEGEDPFPTLPWLDVRNCNCNCSNYPQCGGVLQNMNAQITTLPAQLELENENSDGGDTPDEEEHHTEHCIDSNLQKPLN